MGDDLNFAQKFTRTAADGLSLLSQMDDPRSSADAPVVIDMMTTLQRGAKRLRARHIYTGAQSVLSALHHEPDAILTGRIETLGSVVTEYARGLDELLVQSSAAPAPQSDTEKWTAARTELNALLPIAAPDDADILSRLMRAPVSLEALQPEAEITDMDADILAFTPRETLAEDAAENDMDVFDTILAETVEGDEIEVETHSTPAIAPAPEAPIITPTLDTGPDVQLDALMRDVVADALSVARTAQRTISLSYDMGERSVSETRAADLRTRLGQALSQIIRQALPEDRVGHIDVNLAGEQLHVIAGTTALRVAIDPDAAPAAKPLITQETEQGLRAQLAALMDPISLQGAS